MATSTVTPYLMFKEGQAKEALEFYQGILGGKLEIMKFGDMPGATEHNRDMVMHGLLENDTLTLFASDGMPDAEVVPGNVWVALNGDDAPQLTGFYEQLSQDGTIIEALRKAPWGDTFGMLMDKYQIRWMVNIAAASADTNLKED